jgi:hypothetical protein
VIGQAIADTRIEAQGDVATTGQLRGRLRVATSKERNNVPSTDKLFGIVLIFVKLRPDPLLMLAWSSASVASGSMHRMWPTYAYSKGEVRPTVMVRA